MLRFPVSLGVSLRSRRFFFFSKFIHLTVTCVYVHVPACMYVCMSACVRVCMWRTEFDNRWPCQSLSTWYIERHGLLLNSELDLVLVWLASWAEGLPASAFHVQCLQCLAWPPCFNVGSADPSSSPQSCMASILLTEPFSLLPKMSPLRFQVLLS